MRTKLQLEAIKEVYEMIQRGMTHPVKISNAYKYINDIQGMEVPMRAKIMAINRFMMLSFEEEWKLANKPAVQPKPEVLEESIGTIENKSKHSHQESFGDDDELHNIQGFLSKDEKEELKSEFAGTTLEIVTPDGKKKRTRSPNGTRKARK